MKCLRTLTAACLLGVSSDTAAGGDRPSVEIFTHTAMPIATEFLMQNAIPFTYYDLDAPAALEAELSADLPDDPERAAAMAILRLQRGGAALIERVRQAWQGVAQAKRYGLDRIPAVVFDRNAAVYGVTDAEEALARYQTWQAGHRP